MKAKYIELKAVPNLTSKEAIEGLSATLYNLSRPETIKDPKDVAKYLFAAVPHPTIDGDYVLQVDEDFVIEKHTAAVATEILTFVDKLAQVDKTEITSYIDNNTTISVSALLALMKDEISSYSM